MRLLFCLCFLIPGLLRCEPWVIVANGPRIPSEGLKEACKHHKVLVLDGAANYFQELSLTPDVILGDFDSVEDPVYWGITETFDSIDESSEPYSGHFDVTIVPAKDQDHTDLEKGILYCKAQGATFISIVQATGGRLDHTLGNLGVLRKYYQVGCPLILVTELEKVCYLKDGKMTIEHAMGGYCGVMGYPRAVMTTSGLAYNGISYPLEIGIQESTCNKVAEPVATVAIEGEALLIFPKSAHFTP